MKRDGANAWNGKMALEEIRLMAGSARVGRASDRADGDCFLTGS